MALFSRETQAIFYNYKPAPIQNMLDFDYVCYRETPSVAAVVTPGATSGGFRKAFFGHREITLPEYGSLAEAAHLHPEADVLINFASYRSAFDSSLEALRTATIKTVVIIAEGVPERETKRLIAEAGARNKLIIGPATVGAIQAGAFKVADTAGTLDNILRCRLHRPGSVGFVSKSGGLSNEMYNVLARETDGIFEGIAIGGDTFPGSTLLDHVRRFESIPEIAMIVMLGELGGVDELRVAEAIRKGDITKPLVAWVSGTCATRFQSTEVQFGHAGARAGQQDRESASAKNAALKAAGAIVPQSFESFATAIRDTFASLKRQPVPERDPRPLPLDMAEALRSGKLRKATNIVCTISDDRGDEVTYAGMPISTIIRDDLGVGDVISLLWFKRRLPRWATKFIEMCLVIAADHGPCVSGAHNAIVTARAGKDVVSSLCSGLLTIGPRFGGAIDDAALNFMRGADEGIPPDEFVESLKASGRRIEGIGHRIKSASSRDRRVQLLSQYARENFPSVRYLTYAEAIEAYTLQKSPHLVLNIDGCIGALFADLLRGVSDILFHQPNMDPVACTTAVRSVIELGALNALFVLARSIGIIGHIIDQRRMKQPLYRHPWDDVLYATNDDVTSLRWNEALRGDGSPAPSPGADGGALENHVATRRGDD
jgi:ATP citrate (pro-S)-lyase